MQRRHFLQALAAIPALSFSTKLLAAPETDTKFLLVFLRGGYDAANLLVPHTSSFYYESRPTIAIPKPTKDSLSGLPIDSDWSLHPALKNNLYPLFERKQLAFIPFAGTDDLSRSHFETQDTIELGQPIGTSRNFQSGFMNRLAEQLGGKSAITFTEQVPLTMRGNVEIPNIALHQISKSNLNKQQTDAIKAMYKNTELHDQVEQGFDVREKMGEAIKEAMAKADRQAISTKGFESEAKRIATLMRGEFNLGFVDVGGWDTHVAQGSTSGNLAARLEELGRGLAAFAEGMGNTWSKTVVVVVSEFGRTFRENGNQGTDHGHGSVYWVMGGSLAGGRVVGEQVNINAKTLFQNRDFPVLNDYRSLLGGLFARQFNLNTSQLNEIFPNVSARDLGLL
jgi:uncharacterized protein (DUF1501 family)